MRVAAATLALRCVAVMTNETPVNPSKPKELTDAVLTESAADFTVIPAASAGVVGPVATWLNVHTLADASHAVVVVVRINCEVPAYTTVAVSPPVVPVQATVGVEVRKKPVGKVMVIWLDPAAAKALAS